MMINHSKAYTIAVCVSWLEFWVEYLLFGSSKFRLDIAGVGFIVVVAGQTIRALAMYHCGEHFNHVIMTQKEESHKLVTTGIYKYLRHPSYFGWFYWTIGTQVCRCC